MPKGRKGKRTKGMINIANERIEILFDLAESEAKAHNFDRASRYVELARKIGMRYNVRVPTRYRRRYCKYCHSYFIPTINSRFRIRGKKLIIYCENCGEYMRMPYAMREKGRKGDKKEIKTQF